MHVARMQTVFKRYKFKDLSKPYVLYAWILDYKLESSIFMQHTYIAIHIIYMHG